jgi:hypothetical protein
MGVIPVYRSGDLDHDNILDQTETWTYNATGLAIAGNYANTATVTANTGTTPSTVTDSDPSWYHGVQTSVNAGLDQNVCTNLGNVPLTVPLTGVSSGGPATYLWTTSGTGSFTNPTGLSTNYIPSAGDINNVFVTITLKATGTCPGDSSSDGMTITFIPIPQPWIEVRFPL